MNASEQGKMLLAEWEGFECRVYLDIAGKQAIGIGHLLTKDELSSGKIYIQGKAIKYDDGLTEHQVLNLLDQDLKEVERTLNKFVKVTLTQHQFDALTSFVLNVGSYAFKKSILPKYLGDHFFAQPHKISNVLLTFH